MSYKSRILLFLWVLATASNGCAQSENPRIGPAATLDENEAKNGRGSDEASGFPYLAQEILSAPQWLNSAVAATRKPDRTSTIPPGAKFVARGGDDSGPGTELQPWRSILPSFGKLNPGDTLVIRGGTYTAEGSSELCGGGDSAFGLVGKHGDAQSWTTIMGYPGERPKLYHGDGWQTLYVCDSSFVRISHLEVFGEANAGNDAPASGVYVKDSHHIVIEDIWSHDNGGCGICSSTSNHVTFRGNRVWNNSQWNPYQTSGISIFQPSNAGGPDDPEGYTNYITGNLIWNNFEDDSIGDGQPWGVTDGNGIIIDLNIESGATGRTLIGNNILVNNGGPGIMITRSHAVDIVNNSLYQNVKTRIESVVNNGEIGCNGSHDLKVQNNIVVPRNDNPYLFRNYSCSDFAFANNVWVRSGAPVLGEGDIVLPSETAVFSDPRLIASSGCWTTLGPAAQHGAHLSPPSKKTPVDTNSTED